MPAVEDISPARRWLRPALWTALVRHLVPVVGVLALGWHPLDVLVFLFVETWLFLTLRMGTEGVLNRRFGDVPTTAIGALGQLCLFVPILAVVFGFVMGLVGLVVQQLAFGADDWRAFLETAAWRTPLYRIALALVAVEQVGEAVAFALRLARTSGPEIADDLRLQRMVQRVVFLAAAGLVAGFAPAAGARGVVVAIAAAMFVWEAWPDEAAPPAEPARPADAAAAAPRTKPPRRGRSRRG
jgi:hypothetical protein